MEKAFTGLTASEVSGWFYLAPVGYYVERDRVYLQGEAVSTAAATQLLLTNLPAAIRPASPVTVTVRDIFSQMDETPDLGSRSLPLDYAITITPGGDVMLSALPAYVTSAPPDQHLQPPTWTTDTPNYGPLVLQIPLGPISWDLALATHTYPSVSLAPYLGPDFTDIDSQIGTYGSRAELTGRVRANRDGAGDGQGAGRQPYLFSGLPRQYELVDVSGLPDLAGDTGWTVGQSPEGAIPIAVGNDGSGGYGQVQTDEGPFIPPVTSFRPVPNYATSPSPSAAYFGLQGFDARDRLVVAGPDAIDLPYQSVSFIIPVVPPGGGTEFYDFDVNAYLDLFAPTPDWFALAASVISSQPPDVPTAFGPQPPPPANPTITPDAPSQLLESSGNPATVHVVGGNSILSGWVCQLSAEYAGDPTNTASVCLWRPGEVNVVQGFGDVLSGDPTIGVNGSWAMTLYIAIFYQKRNLYLRAGDVLDLTGGGWEVAPRSIVNASPGPQGILRHHGAMGLQIGPNARRQYDIAALVWLARSVGFVSTGANSAATAAAVAMAESSGEPQALNVNADGSEDRGLWQINNVAHPTVSDTCAYNPPCCATAAYVISAQGTDFTPWAAFNNGAYLQFLAAAQAVP